MEKSIRQLKSSAMRAFGVLLSDAKLLDNVGRLDYIQYWGKKREVLDNAPLNG